MDEYLQICQDQLTSLEKYAEVYVVLGNEACDLDSAVSALVYAFYLHTISRKDNVVHFPVLNIPKEDYALRTEVTYFLRKNGIKDENLMFSNQLDLFRLHKQGKLKLILVDFNLLTGCISALEEATCQVIDHHKREFPENTRVDVTVEAVGSCCTLIAEKLLNDTCFQLSSSIALLLYGTILLDTVCLSDAAGRTTSKDKSVITKLEELAQPVESRQDMFQDLQAAKADIAGLTTQELLRKDVKVVTSETLNVAISSVPVHILDFLSRRGVEDDLASFSSSNKVEVVVVMAIVITDTEQPNRQIAVYSSSSQYRQQVVNVLVQSKDPHFELSPISSDLENITAFCQNNVKASRKKVLPVIKAFLIDCGTETEMASSSLPGGLPVPTISLDGASLHDQEDGEDRLAVAEEFESCVKSNTNMNNYQVIPPGCSSDAIVDSSTADLSMEMFDPLASDSPIGKPSTPDQNSSMTTPELQKSYPSTPPNSVLESSVLESGVINTKQHNLPSFNSLEMVQRIQQKKAALDVISESYSLEAAETAKFPFTPSNSLVDDEFSKHMDSNLPSFNSSEMVAKISQKRSAFAQSKETDVGEAHHFPYTPPNSFADNTLDSARNADLNIDHQDFLHKMFTKKRERNHSEVMIYPRNVEEEQLPEEMTGNVVAIKISREMATAEADGKPAEVAMADNIVKEMIEDALDTCDPAELQKFMEKKDSQESGTCVNTVQKSDTVSDDTVETEYLSEVDPLQGSIDIVKFPKRQFSTDADREVAESTSFNLHEEERHKLHVSISESESEVPGDRKASADGEQSDTNVSAKIVGRRGKAPTLEKAVNFWVAASTDKGGTGSEKGEFTEIVDSDVRNVLSHNSESRRTDHTDTAVADDTVDQDSVGQGDSSLSDSDSSSAHSCSTSEGSYRVAADADSLQSSLDASFLGRIEEMSESESHEDVGSVNHLGEEVLQPVSHHTVNVALYAEADHIVKQVFSSITAADLGDCLTKSDSSHLVHDKCHATGKEELNNNEKTYRRSWEMNSETLTSASPMAESKFSLTSDDDRDVTHAAVSGQDQIHKAPSDTELKLSRTLEQLQIPQKKSSNISVAPCVSSEIQGDDSNILNTSLPEDLAMETGLSPLASDEEDVIMRKAAERPQTLLEKNDRRKIVPNMDLLKDDETLLSHSSLGSVGSVSMSEDEIMANVENVKTPDDLSTPDALNNSVFDGELTWGNDDSPGSPAELIPEYTASDEFRDERNWRSVTIAEKQFRIDMKVIEPYKKVLSHGGYYGDGLNAIVVFCACYLPDRSRRDYHYVMDNLFLYVISTLELLVVEDYMIVYFHGATPRQKMPNLRWLKRCYEMIDRRLRKNLKKLFIVHPTFWLKTIVLMTKPFISSKFSSKLHYVRSIEEMKHLMPTEYIYIPDEIKAYDARKNKTSPSPPASP